MLSNRIKRAPNWTSCPSINATIHAWVELTAILAGEPEIALSMLSYYENRFLALCIDPVEAQAGRRFKACLEGSDFYQRPVEEIMEAFRGTPALAEEFDLPVIPLQCGVSIPENLFRALRSEQIGAKLRQAFAAERKTFGSAFMQAAMAEESAADALLTFLGERVEELSKLPPARQQRIATLHRAAMSAAGAQNGKSESISKALAWLRGQQESARQDGK